MRPAGLPRKIGERNFVDAKALRERLDQYFFLHLKIHRLDIQIGQRLASIKAKPARHIPHRHREHSAQAEIEHAAQPIAPERGVGDAAGNVAGSDNDVGLIARAPHLRDEGRIVRHVSVERQHVVAASLGKAGLHRAGITAAALRQDARTEFGSCLACTVAGISVDHDDLEVETLARPSTRASAGSSTTRLSRSLTTGRIIERSIIATEFLFGLLAKRNHASEGAVVRSGGKSPEMSLRQ